ncbi:hypothetical protein NDU88_004427 [Pleurodeles waltl]|uniref:Uncharacterized protein n=1 Tax=Pleurodeles waltl TaxID=8319 RepID=A0AAV7N2Y7_PLEWA|nr:hypothetical protein NDU88_004427 [Pleurodeles waltl]
MKDESSDDDGLTISPPPGRPRRNKLTEERKMNTMLHKYILTQPSLETIWQNFAQFQAVQQADMIQRMCEILMEKWDENLDSNPPLQVLRIKQEVATGYHQGKDLKDYLRQLLSYRKNYHHKRNKETGSASPSRIPSTDTTQHPLREVPPSYVPATGEGAAAVPAHWKQQFVYQQWDRTEVLALKAHLPDPRKNPAGFYKEFSQIISPQILTLMDIKMLFGTLVPQDIWKTIIQKDYPVELGGTWDQLDHEDQDRKPGDKPGALIVALPDRLLTLIQKSLPPRLVDWDRIDTCKQKKDEHIADFFSRFERAYTDFSGQDASTEGGMRLFVDKFVNCMSPEVALKIRLAESTWSTSTPSQILTMAQYYENRVHEEKDKKDKQTKELKTKVLVQQAYPLS